MLRNIIRDPELWFIVLFNALIILFYYLGQVDPRSVILIYYFQSIIIGLFHFLRLYKLSNFNTDNFTSNGKPVEATRKTARSTAFFFLFHYGFFHFVYFVFLTIMIFSMSDGKNGFDTKFFLFSIFSYFVNSLFSLRYHVERDKEEKPNIGSLMFLPYLRVFPMHIFIIAGMGLELSKREVLGFDVLELFVLLKTLSDVAMHVLSEKTWKPHNRRLPWEVLR